MNRIMTERTKRAGALLRKVGLVGVDEVLEFMYVRRTACGEVSVIRYVARSAGRPMKGDTCEE